MPRQPTFIEVQRHIRTAEVDLQRLRALRSSLDRVPVKLSTQDNEFLNNMWPLDEVIPEMTAKSDEALPKDWFFRACEHWRKKLDEQIQYTVDYLKKATGWVDLVKARGYRCALPKKKQRELGMLPPAPCH